MSDRRYGKIKMGEPRRLSCIGKGSFAAGRHRPPHISPRLAISFPQALFDELKMEAINRGTAVAEIVRRRLHESYRLRQKVEQQ